MGAVIAAKVVRVALLGAESTGKSTLAAALAARYRTLWVPEYLREFVETAQRVPVAADQFSIAATQVAREESALAAAERFLFCDTTPLMTAIYSGFYFNGADAALAQLARERTYDFTVVTPPDTPWVADGLQRESAAMRDAVHRELLAVLARMGIAYLMVSGDLAQRTAQVARHIDPSAQHAGA